METGWPIRKAVFTYDLLDKFFHKKAQSLGKVVPKWVLICQDASVRTSTSQKARIYQKHLEGLYTRKKRNLSFTSFGANLEQVTALQIVIWNNYLLKKKGKIWLVIFPKSIFQSARIRDYQDCPCFPWIQTDFHRQRSSYWVLCFLPLAPSWVFRPGVTCTIVSTSSLNVVLQRRLNTRKENCESTP